MKTEKELQELTEKAEDLDNELNELTEEELAQVAGGRTFVHLDIINSGSNRMRPAVSKDIISAGH